jgi:hypothetical protein
MLAGESGGGANQLLHNYSVGLSQNVTVTAWEHRSCTLNYA